MRYALIDSSSLRALAFLDLATQLSWFFSAVYVPKQVQAELSRKHRFRHRLNKLYATGIYRRCLVANRVNVRLLIPQLDEGEAEGIIQAQENGIRHIILDERKARAVASNMSIKPVGIARLLFRIELDGQIDDAAALIQKLRVGLRFRISEDVLIEARTRAEEPI